MWSDDISASALVLGLFVVLSPGIFLTLPTLGLTDLTAKGISSGAGGTNVPGAAATACASVGITAPAQCKKAAGLWRSGQTTMTAAFVHTIVFACALFFLAPLMAINLSYGTLIVSSVLFFVLSPGILLNLPKLSMSQCASRNVADDGNFCDTGAVGKCAKCNSFWRSGFTEEWDVLVHGVLLAAIVYVVSTKLFYVAGSGYTPSKGTNGYGYRAYEQS
jgi:hypothetical protein